MTPNLVAYICPTCGHTEHQMAAATAVAHYCKTKRKFVQLERKD